MHPVLLKIGSIEIHSYGTGVLLAFIAMMLISVKRARRFNLTPDRVMNVTLVLILVWCVGARLGYIALHFGRFKGNWLAAVNPFQFLRHGSLGFSGWVAAGGHLSAFLTIFLCALRYKVSFISLGNIFLPGLLFATGIWKTLACFLTGCCFGRPTESALGVIYPFQWYLSTPHPIGTPVWPVQLFASALAFFGVALFYWLERRFRFPDFSLWLVVAYWALGRMLVDQFRYYEASLTLLEFGPFVFNVNHLAFGGIFLFSLACLFHSRPEKKNTDNGKKNLDINIPPN